MAQFAPFPGRCYAIHAPCYVNVMLLGACTRTCSMSICMLHNCDDSRYLHACFICMPTVMLLRTCTRTCSICMLRNCHASRYLCACWQWCYLCRQLRQPVKENCTKCDQERPKKGEAAVGESNFEFPLHVVNLQYFTAQNREFSIHFSHGFLSLIPRPIT